jgi:hypothetical protein
MAISTCRVSKANGVCLPIDRAEIPANVLLPMKLIDSIATLDGMLS